jgi:putative transposase
MEIYHILNRGVDKRNIFLEDGDCIKFIHDLYEFNDEDPAPHPRMRPNVIIKKKRKLIVELLAFVLMPNHFHLLLIPKIKNGVYLFMKKLGCGYARYFNEKYQRTGVLFERRYKRILITKEAHFIHLPYYIHCNPLDLKYPEWRKRELKDLKGTIDFLNSYRWSSHLDYCGKDNFSISNSKKIPFRLFW